MANEQEIVFEINVDAAVQSLAALRKATTDLTEANKSLDQQLKEGTITQEEYNKQVEQNNSQRRNNQKDIQAQQRILDNFNKTVKLGTDTQNFANNSIEKNRRLLSQLTEQYKLLDKPSLKATNTLKSLTDTLKGQEKAIGDSRRNVGNYSEFLGQLSGGLGSLGGGFGDAGKAALGFGTALATGTGGLSLIIPAIIQFVNLVSTNAEVADQLSFAMGGINKVFQTFAEIVVDGVKSLGFLKNAFSDPIGTIKELGKVIVDNVVNRLKSVLVFGESLSLFFKGQWQASAKAFTNATLQLTTGLTDLSDKFRGSFEQGSESAQKMDELTSSMALANAEISKNNALIEKNTDILKNKDLSIEQRTKAAKEIAKLEKENADNQVKIAKAELEAFELEVKGVSQSNEIQAQRITLQAKIDTALIRSAAVQEGLSRRISMLRGDEAKSDKQGYDTSKDLLLKRIIDYNKYWDEREKADEEGLKKNAETEKKLVENNAKTLATISKQNSQSYEEFLKQKEKEEQAIQQQQESTINAIIQIGSSVGNLLGTVSDAIQQSASNNVAVLNDQLEQGIITQEKFEAESRELKLKAWKQSKAIAITQAVINTANAVMAQLSNPTPYVGIVLAALAAATGAVQIGIIASQKPPKFAEGGEFVVGGQPHSAGGTKYYGEDGNTFEAERGERIFVMKRTASERIGELSAWNQKHGGNSWTGSPVGFAAEGGIVGDGGFVARDMSRQSSALTAGEMEGIMRRFPQPKLSIVELESKQNNRNRSISVSEA